MLSWAMVQGVGSDNSMPMIGSIRNCRWALYFALNPLPGEGLTCTE